MPRHQLLQLPSALVIGLMMGEINYKPQLTISFPRISILLFLIGSLIFWMLPLSVDLSVIDPKMNWLMLLNMFLAGYLSLHALKNANLEIKVIFYATLTAKLIGVGLVLSSLDILLCSAFTIAQQNTTGNYLIGIGTFFLLVTFVTFFRETGK